MTDSMKFGPEWLRNMSSDSTNIGVNTSAGNSLNNFAIAANNSNIGSSQLPVPMNLVTARNVFPEFRYGREEMLSLFDKNSRKLPEILPSYKNIFIEKVQIPLALTPTTDEEMVPQGPVLTSRPTWIQRSPVGFSSSPRISRGGLTDRGRMRGKSLYHPGYPRPTAMFEDELRPAPKTERGWSERNGVGDAVAGLVNLNIGNDWNVASVSSPRKDFSAQSRNLENWRQSRKDDGSGDSTTSVQVGSDGWRGSGSNHYGNSHRWGRSTSWRGDEDGGLTAAETTYSGIPMQRSYSTIATTERSNLTTNSLGKSYQSSSEKLTSGRGLASNNNPQLLRNSQWSHSIGINSNAEVDDNLPEWAVENTSGSRGTFDASGAFHGSNDEAESSKDDIQDKDTQSNSDYATNQQQEIPLDEKAASSNDFSQTPQASEQEHTTQKSNNETTTNALSQAAENFEVSRQDDAADNLPDISATTISHAGYFDTHTSPMKSALPAEQVSLNRAYSDTMKEAADDMVDKLIMEDDAVQPVQGNNMCADGNSIANSSNANTVPLQVDFVAASSVVGMLTQSPQHQTNMTDSPSILHSEAMLTQKLDTQYSAEEHIADHHQAKVQQQQQQQLHMNSAASHGIAEMPHLIESTPPTELWYYRDPQGKVQGPFTAVEMTEWYRMGYFNEDLFVRRGCDNRYRALGELIKICHGQMPFTHTHLIPVDTIEQAVMPPVMPPVHRQKPIADDINFQIFQETIRQNELLIANELAKSEAFRLLSSMEKDAVVRQKSQMMMPAIPGFFSYLAGLPSVNPLCNNNVMNSSVGGCSSTDNVSVYSGSTPSQGNVANAFLNTGNYVMNPTEQKPLSQFACNIPYAEMVGMPVPVPEAVKSSKNMHIANELSESDNHNEYNMRAFLAESNDNQANQEKPQVLVRDRSGDYAQSNPMLQMWIPPFVVGGQNNFQHSNIVSAQPHHATLQNQWAGESLGGMPNAVIGSLPNASESILQFKLPAAPLWNVLLKPEEEQAVMQSKDLNFCKSEASSLEQASLNKITAQDVFQVTMNEQNSLEMEQKLNLFTCTDSSTDDPLAKLKKENVAEKQELYNKKQRSATKYKEENLIKKTEEERRREMAEEKRRQREDRKRQLQVEEEKRRLQQKEEETRRQNLEEKDRQMQIQMHRKKAMQSNVSNPVNAVAAGTSAPAGKFGKEQQQRIKSSIAPWSTQSNFDACKTGPSLAEIQKAERRERRADQQRQMESLERQFRNNSTIVESSESPLKWNASTLPVKNLAEIQAEEAKRLAIEMETQRRKEQEQAALSASTVSAAAGNIGQMSNIWGNATKVWGSLSSTAFWEDPKLSKEASASVSNVNNSASPQGLANNTKQAQPSKQQKQTFTVQDLGSSRNIIKKSQTISVMQSSQSNVPTQPSVSKPQQKIDADKKAGSTKNANTGKPSYDVTNNKDPFENEFSSWCTRVLINMNANVDVPTFVSFLQDLESPYEVKDYIRMYLGEGKEYADFAKQFLERRSKYKNLQRAQNAHNDDMCKPAPAITPSAGDNSDSKGKQKKIKKSKMTKLDARILGFSVTAAEGRINVGDRDYVDAP